MKKPTLPRRSTAPVICVDDSDDEKDCPIFEKIDPKTRQEIQKNSSVDDLTADRREIVDDRKMSRSLSITQDREIKELLKTLQVYSAVKLLKSNVGPKQVRRNLFFRIRMGHQNIVEYQKS